MEKEYIDEEEYYALEEQYVNSEETLHEEEYLDFKDLKNEELEKESNRYDIKKILYYEFYNKYKCLFGKTTNREVLVEEFIENFLKTFPGIYTKKQLKSKLDINLWNVFEIPKEYMEKYVGGTYLDKINSIVLRKESTSRMRFHEFVHALRGYETNNEILLGIIEGFAAYSDFIYQQSSDHDFKIKYNRNVNFLFKNKDFWIDSSYYKPLVLIMQELDYVYKLINSEETLLTSYLKGENIYSKINEIYKKYYETLAKKEKIEFDINEYEFDIMKTTYLLIEKIDELRVYTIDDTIEKDKILLKINEIEKEIYEVFSVLNNKRENEKRFSNLMLTMQTPLTEEKNSTNTFGETCRIKEKHTFEERIDQARKVKVKE